MKRKVIQLAGKTAVISLPSKWVRQYNILKGAELDLLEQGSDLLIKSTSEKVHDTITMDISSFNEMTLRYCLSALHKTGYDEITLIYGNPRQVEILQDMIKNLLLGFVIIEHKQKRIVLKSITSDINTEFDPALRRAFLVTLSLSEASFEMAKVNNFSDMNSLISLEKTNNQLTSFCLRLINKGVYTDNKTSHFLSTIVWALEKIADEYKYMCVNLSKNPDKIRSNILNLYEETNLFFKSYYELFYKFDVIKLNELADKRYRLVKSLNEITPKNKAENILLNNLNAIVSKTTDLSSSIFGMRHANLKEVKKDVL